MRKIRIYLYLGLGLSALFAENLNAQKNGDYKIKEISIQTRWAKEVSPSNALKEYPRPQMVRNNWTNLNGIWEYAITEKDAKKPTVFSGKILVPYPIESALSGVKRTLLPTQILWYRCSVARPVTAGGKRVKLNFGAVDYEATAFVNDTEVGKHIGGYTDFSFDITDALKDGPNEIVVKVVDPTDQGVGPHGKQVLNPANIYYTPSSGIWQTVWMEVVSATSINRLSLTPDIDKGILYLNADAPSGFTLEAIAYDGGKIVSTGTSLSYGHLSPGRRDSSTVLKIPNAKLWSPASPFLYDLVVRLKKGSLVVDEVKSYFGMRKISVGRDSKGIDRIMLNNKAYFNLGTLDQGFWPDGLYTAPTDEALAFDMKAIMAMGFNTIRKHIKVEPSRWYYWADKLGILVWQDMVNPNQGLPEGSKAAFEKGSAEILQQLHNYPSITTWVLFNEKWGQYDQERLTKWIKTTDPSNPVNVKPTVHANQPSNSSTGVFVVNC